MSKRTANEDSLVELALATELQAGLLPTECPSDCPHQEVAARNRMCGGVGGDFYDFLRINDEQIAIVIGDVIGHGVRAGLVMAQIMGYLRSHPASLARPKEIIASLNRMLIDLGHRTGKILSCSMFYTVIDAPTGISFYVNMGHPSPFICENARSFIINPDPHNLLLGVEEFDPVEGCHTFTPTQRLVLYTDGLTDASDSDGHLFGRQRLHKVVSAATRDGPEDCADAVFRAVDEFRGDRPQDDDETIVVVDRV